MAKTKKQAQVVSINGSSATVLNSYKTRHPKYNKIIKRTKKFIAENEVVGLKVGDAVEIEECAPISKNKYFKIVRVI